MNVTSTDTLVDALRIDLAQMGCVRPILLGTADDMGDPALKAGLARWGLQVMAPPVASQPWVASLAEGDMHPSDQARLAALLADGTEHGADAIVLTDARLEGPVRACDLRVPVLVADPLGSAVRVRNVVLDMGGVLFRWEPLAMARRVCEADDDAALLAKAVFGSQEWAWQDAGAVDEETVIWTAKERLPRRLRPLVDGLVLHWHEHRVPIEGMDALVRDLKGAGYGVYLLSNAGASFERYEAQLPGRDCLDGMVVSYRERLVKPDRRIYQALIGRYGLTAGECLFVDDTPANVLGARRAGMRAVRFDGNAGALRALLLR